MTSPIISRRASCGYVWNTPESGPCMLRPISSSCPDNPVWDQNTQILSDNCYSFNDKETGDPKLSKNGVRIFFVFRGYP